MTPQERVARAILPRLTENILRHADVPHEWIAAIAGALAQDTLAIVRAICLDECAAIRRGGHVTDTEDEQERREQRALVAWRLAERFGGNDD